MSHCSTTDLHNDLQPLGSHLGHPLSSSHCSCTGLLLFLPQGLCTYTCCSLCLRHPSSRYSRALSSPSLVIIHYAEGFPTPCLENRYSLPSTLYPLSSITVLCVLISVFFIIFNVWVFPLKCKLHEGRDFFQFCLLLNPQGLSGAQSLQVLNK